MRVQLKSHLEVDLCAISHFLDEWGKERQETNVTQKVTCYFFGGRCIHDLQLQSTSKTCLSFQLWRGPREESYYSLIYNYRFQRWPIRKQITYAAMDGCGIY